jgi:hypothetical protein
MSHMGRGRRQSAAVGKARSESHHLLNRRVPVGADHREIAEARLAARERPLRSARGVLNDEGRWAAAASHRALRECKIGDTVRLQLIETPSVQVTLRVERVSSRRSTALTGAVLDATREAVDLQFDLARGFYSYHWELVPVVEELAKAADAITVASTGLPLSTTRFQLERQRQ